MGYFAAHPAPVSADEHVKTLEDEELLDFWEESQYMEGMIQGCGMMFSTPAGGYERLIIQELQLRSCLRNSGKSQLSGLISPRQPFSPGAGQKNP